MNTLPQPWTVAMEATIFTGWIYDHLLPHAQQVKVAHPLMLRAIAAAKKKNDRIDAGKIENCLRCDFLPECHMAPPFAIDAEPCATATCWYARWCR
jgi:transposase